MKIKRTSVLILLSLLCVVAAAFCLYGCAAGKDGADGKSAYEIWLEEGHSGSKSDFLEWLKGDKGQDGENGSDGKSAYQIWLDNGFEGTEADFLDWLKNQSGSSGEDENKWNVSKNPAVDNLTATLNNNVLTVSGSGNMKDWTKAEDVAWVELSKNINRISIGKNVTGIGSFAFAGANISSLIVSTIHAYCF